MTKKEELVEELIELTNECHYSSGAFPGMIADFIISDRMRIVKPLIKYINRMNGSRRMIESHDAIDQTLTNAGIELERN